MSDESTDHRHRNIAAIVEYLDEAGVIVTNVTTPDNYEDDIVTFDLVVPPIGPHELRDDEVSDDE